MSTPNHDYINNICNYLQTDNDDNHITVVTSNRSCPSDETVGTEDMADDSSIECDDWWEPIQPSKMTMPTQTRAWQQLRQQERPETL